MGPGEYGPVLRGRRAGSGGLDVLDEPRHERYPASQPEWLGPASPGRGDGGACRNCAGLYERRDAFEARRDLQAWLEKWQAKYPKLCAWVEANIEETWSFYQLPLPHHKHLKSTNMLERFNQEIKRRTLVVRIFPDEASCLR